MLLRGILILAKLEIKNTLLNHFDVNSMAPLREGFIEYFEKNAFHRY